MDHRPNGERASIAVTRHGCWQGESSEGYGANGKGPDQMHAQAAARPHRKPLGASGTARTQQGRPRHPARGPKPTGRSMTPRGVGGCVRGRNGNVANPMIGSRAQQTCKAQGGASRRSREERQGRNESGAWQLRAEGGRRVPACRGPSGPKHHPGQPTGKLLGANPRARHARSGRQVLMSMEGRSMTTPREESGTDSTARTRAARPQMCGGR